MSDKFFMDKVDNLVKQYYFRLREIEKLKSRLEILYRQQKEIIDNIKELILSPYNKVKELFEKDELKVCEDKPVTVYEKSVERVFERLETEADNIKAEIIDTKTDILQLEKDNSEIGFAIEKLDKDYKLIIETIYKYNKKILEVSIDLNMDKSTVSRKRKKALFQLSSYINKE